jgi:hypothetical protein
MERGDIERLYQLSDPLERKTLELTHENFRAAYDAILRPFFQEWKVAGFKVHPSVRQFRLTLPPDDYLITVTYENAKGQRYRAVLTTRRTDEGWRVSFGRAIYNLFLRSYPDIPKEAQRRVLKGLLQSGFYVIITEHPAAMHTVLLLQELEVGNR